MASRIRRWKCSSKLYEGYVKETNKLTEKISEFLADGIVDQDEMPAYSEPTRRLGFEYNGMVLHEYYFGNMKQGDQVNQIGKALSTQRRQAVSAATRSGKRIKIFSPPI
jgi:superoxide dismutase